MQKTPIFFQFSLLNPPQWTFRGSNAAHSLLLIDENPIYDPSTIQGTWDFNLWPGPWSKSILIDTSPLEGPIKWGGQASGMLIKITTINNSNLNLNTNSKQSISSSAGKHFENGQLQLLSENKKIQSPFIDSNEYYPIKNYQGLAKLIIPLTEFEDPINTLVLYGESERNLPDWNQDTKNFKSIEKHQTVSINWHPRHNQKDQTLSLQMNAFERKYLNTSINPFEEKYFGNSVFLNYFGKYQITDENYLSLGFSYKEENLKTLLKNQNQPDNKIISTPVYFSQEYFFSQNLTLQWGLRLEKNGLIPGNILNPALEIYNHTWSLGLFQTVKPPSLFQLYDSFSGNPNLTFENIQQVTLENHGTYETHTYQILIYKRKSKNVVDFDKTSSKYNNIADSFTTGLEGHISLDLMFFKWELMGTLQNSRDQQSKQIAPDKILNNSWSIPISSKTQFQITGIWNSEIKAGTKPAYSLWNCSLLYQSQFDSQKNNFAIAINNLSQTKVISNNQNLIEDRTINFVFNSEF
jgi:hypothetical protein